jgi:hypothetical protein
VAVGNEIVVVWREEHQVVLEWWDFLVCILLIAKAYGHPPFLEENAKGNGNLNSMSISIPIMLHTNGTSYKITTANARQQGI